MKSSMCLVALGLAALAPDAAASTWHWQGASVASGDDLCAQAVAESFAIGCGTPNAFGSPVWGRSSNGIWATDGSARAMSITQNTVTGHPWLVGNDNSIWHRESNGWVPMPTNRCEGNGSAISMRRVLGDHSIAAGYDCWIAHRGATIVGYNEKEFIGGRFRNVRWKLTPEAWRAR